MSLRIKLFAFQRVFQRVQQWRVHDDVQLGETRNEESEKGQTLVLVEVSCDTREHAFPFDWKQEGDEGVGSASLERCVDLQVVPDLGDNGVMVRFPGRRSMVTKWAS